MRALEGILQIDENHLTAETVLGDLKSWDSMGVLEFQAMADEDLGVQVEPAAIERCRTADDLWKLVADGAQK